MSLKGENKAGLRANVKWHGELNVGTLVSVRAGLERGACSSGEDPAVSAGSEQAHLPSLSSRLSSKGLI